MTTNTQNLHIIFGAGPVGRAIMNELVNRGESVRIINRSGGTFPEGVENVRGDVLEGDFAVRASEGATHIYFALNPEYTQWLTYFQPMQDAVLNAAIAHNAKLIVMENVYMYGDTQGKPMTETTPHNAHTRKGALRARMTQQLLEAHKAGKVRVTMGRASDFYGAGVRESAMGERALAPIIEGKPAEYMGNPDTRHSQTYMPDVGRALVTLALDDRADGRAWHIPNASAITQRAFLEKAFSQVGHAPKLKALPAWMLTFLSPFVPILRELKEMQYEFTQDFIVDSSDFEQTFGWSATPYDEGIAQTMAWYGVNHGAS
jgi:nucleoside-diphosphate-sugar epimerase